MRKAIGCLLALFIFSGSAWAKCVSGVSYQLKGYMESDAGIPVTTKTLSEVLFDIKYDDGTDSLGNAATAEMVNGWYRFAYTSNGKNGVYTMRDSTSTYKQFPGAALEGICDAQDPAAIVAALWGTTLPGSYGSGTAGYNLDSQVSAAGGDPWSTALPGAYGAGTAGNIVGNRLDAAVTSRLASGNVTVGGYAAGQAPADSVLATPANKLATDGTGRVTVGTNADKTGYTASTVSDKTGYSLSAAGVDAIWDEAQSGHTAAGTFGRYLDAQVANVPDLTLGAPLLGGPYGAGSLGQLVYDNLDVAVSSRLVSGNVTVGTNNDKTGYTLSAAGVDAVWDEAKAGHVTAGTFGYNLDVPVSTVGGGGGGVADWTTDEKNQLRYRLGIDGTEAAPATNTPSLGTLTANVADKTGFSLAADQSAVTVGTVNTVTNPVTAGTVTDKTGYALSAAGVDAVLNDTIEGAYTARQVLCAMASVLAGRVTGGGTTTITFRDLSNTVNRVSETVDANGNRSSVTFNLTGCQ